MLKNNLFLKLFLITLSFNIAVSASNDAPFGDILLHHVTNDQSHIYVPIPEIAGIDLSINLHPTEAPKINKQKLIDSSGSL